MPKVSIIVPIYNAERYLNKCIKSILFQHYQDFELILVNDGSYDSSGKICEKYASVNTHVKVLNLKNEGASTARNKGLNIATGDFVWFIDADDWIEKDFLCSIDWSHMPDILYFGYNRIENTTTEKCKIECDSEVYTENYGEILNKLFVSKEQFFGFTWNKIFSRKIIEDYQIRFNEDLIIKEDEVFTLEYCKYISNVGISSATPYNYRIIQGSISHSVGNRKKMLELALYLEKEIDNCSYPLKLRNSFRIAICDYLVQAMFEANTDSELLSIVKKYCEFIGHNKDIKLAWKNKLLLHIPSKYLKTKLIKMYSFLAKRKQVSHYL